jgi:hypothetical protein
MRKKRSPFIAFFVVMAIIVLYAVIHRPDKSTYSTPSIRPAPSKPESSTPQSKPEPGSQWRYSSDEDQMGRKRSFARVDSSNTLDFGFPYQGSQLGTLTIRKTITSGTNVILRIERGQFLCGIEGCTINVRFDSGPIQRFSASGPNDHGTTTLFLENETRFISQLRKANAVRIESTFYHEGLQTLEFDVQGFRWP